MASAIKKFTAIRKPIYCAKIEADGADFRSALEAVQAFKQRFPEYEQCKYDYEYSEGRWYIKLYRECAIDFI